MYPFPPAPDLACNEVNYAYQHNAFDDNEIAKLIELGEKFYELNEAATGGNVKNPEIRLSKVSWIPLNSDTQWIYDRIRDIVVPMNGKHFQFVLFGFVDHLQYTVSSE